MAEQEQAEQGQVDSKTARRNVISSVFVSVLIGIAFQEMITPVRDSVRSAGITLGTTIYFSVFFLTSMRFFIGNQLHLISDNLLHMRGTVWFYDLFWIIVQTTALIFLGGVSSVEANRASTVGFVGLLIALYACDVLWIVSQWVLGKFSAGWKRSVIPWKWAALNTGLSVGILIARGATGDTSSDAFLWLLLTLSVLAFLIDVLLSDYYDVI